MGREDYRPSSTYAIYGVETSYGVGGSPVVANYFGKVTSVNADANNNKQRIRGIGEGRNINESPNGNFDISGSLDAQVTTFDPFQYAIGKRQGAGTAADPYEIVELDRIGFGSDLIPSLALEVGSEGASNDRTDTYLGTVLTGFSLDFTGPGDPVTASYAWLAKTVVTGTAIETFTVPTDKVFMGHQAAVTWGSDAVECVSLTLSFANNEVTYRALGDRFIKTPTFEERAYDVTMVIKKYFDDTASVLSALEHKEFFFGAVAATGPITGATSTREELNVVITEGAAVGDRIVSIDLADTDLDTWGTPVNLGDGWIEITVGGFAYSGKADGADNVPIRYWTIA